MAGGLELVRDRVTLLESLVATSSDETYSIADQQDAMAKGFLSLRDSHEKYVAETATRFTEMLEDMTTLSEALRKRLDDVESEISLVKKAVASMDTVPIFPTKSKSLNQNLLVVLKVPKSWRIFCGIWSSISRLHAFQMVRKSRSLVCIFLETLNFG